jgi:transcriptional regulator with XRE-family HTH domain
MAPGGAAAEAIAAPTGVPQSPQNRLPGPSCAPHAEQTAASDPPQSSQNRLPSGFSPPHAEQRIYLLLCLPERLRRPRWTCILQDTGAVGSESSGPAPAINTIVTLRNDAPSLSRAVSSAAPDSAGIGTDRPTAPPCSGANCAPGDHVEVESLIRQRDDQRHDKALQLSEMANRTSLARGGWGEALAQVRKDQHPTQGDVAEYMAVSLATLRKWEDGLALPDRSLWPKPEEAMGLPVPDPRVPDHTPAERELIDTMLIMIDELRLLRERLAEVTALGTTAPTKSEDPKIAGCRSSGQLPRSVVQVHSATWSRDEVWCTTSSVEE